MIPIDEQIAGLKIARSSCVAHGLNPCQIDAILASLQRLKAIDEVQVPEQFEFTRADDFLPTTYVVRRTDYDTLRDLLLRESARADAENREVLRLTVERNAAEAKLAEKERENGVRRKLLVEAKKHIHHSDGCDYIHDSSARCDCNYLQLLSRIDAAIKEQK